MVAMRGWLWIIVLFLYVLVGGALTFRAFRYRVDPSAPAWGHQIWYARFFTPEGQGPRRLAVGFYAVGAVALGLWWFLGG